MSENENDERAGFTPPAERKDESSPLGAAEMEYLDRLVKSGEGLLMTGLIFSHAEQLLAKGYARVKKTYKVGGKRGKHELRLIVPTAKGNELAHVRLSLRNVSDGEAS